MSQSAQPLQLFIGFAEKDRALKDEFCEQLTVLQHTGHVEPWSVDEVRAGENSRDALVRAISKADLVIILVSANLFAHVAPENAGHLDILSMSLSARKRVIPIILKACAWRNHPLLRELKPLPASGKPLFAYKGNARAQAYTDVVADIAKYSREQGSSNSTGAQGLHRSASVGAATRRKRAALWAAVMAIIALLVAFAAFAAPRLANMLFVAATSAPAPTNAPAPTTTASSPPSTGALHSHEPKHTETPEADVYAQTGSDNQVPPHRARYEFLILKQSYEWVFESKVDTRLNGRGADIGAYILGPKFRERLECSVGLVGVGAASEEGVEGEEVGRARERAKRLTDWFEDIPNPPPVLPLYKYVLGKYKSTGARVEDAGATTGWQRKAVIVAIVDQENGVDHPKSALDALRRLGSGWLRPDRGSKPPEGSITEYSLYPAFEWLPISTEQPSKALRPPAGCPRFFP